MEQALLDKEVLCIVDTRSIQKYIFHSNSMADTVGANHMMKHLLVDAFVYAAAHVSPAIPPEEYGLASSDENAPAPYFDDPKVKAQILTCAAGNMIVIFRTGALCRDIVRKMSRYYVENTYCQQISSAYVEKTDDNQRDIQNLYKKLGVAKTDFCGSHPMYGLPVIRIERNTGEPVAVIDPATGEELSRTSFIRRAEFAKMNSPLGSVDVSTYTAEDGQEYYAVAHIDGNNMGVSISMFLRHAHDYREDTRLRRIINRSLLDVISVAVRDAMNDMKEALRLTDDELDRAIRIVHFGGDDLNIVADPRVIFSFVECYVSRLKKVTLLELDDFRFRMSICAGIAFVQKDVPFIEAFGIAEECCSNAKKEAKKPENAVNGSVGNWVDFRFSYADSQRGGLSDPKAAFVTSDGVRLMLRPYCLDAEMRNTPHSYEDFRQRAIAFRELRLPQESRDQILRAYDLGRTDIALVANLLSASGYPVAERCGEPLLRLSGGMYALWYDAMEVSGLFEGKEAQE